MARTRRQGGQTKGVRGWRFSFSAPALANKSRRTRVALMAALTLLSGRARVACPLARSARPRRGAKEQRGVTENTRGVRAATRESGLPVESPHAGCAAPRACVARPLVVRAPPPVGGLGERSGGSRSARGVGGLKGAKPRTAVSENTRTASSEGTRRSDSPRAARVASRVACAARPLVVRAPPPARGWSEGVARAERRTGREKKRRRAPQRVPSLLDCGSENRPRRTIVARASSVAMHAGEGSLRTKRQAKKTRDMDNRRQASRRREEHRSARHPCSTAVARTTVRAPRDASVRARARQLTVTVGRRRSMAARRIVTAERRTTTRAMRRVGTAGQRYVGNADRSHDRQLETNVSAPLNGSKKNCNRRAADDDPSDAEGRDGGSAVRGKRT